MKKLSRFVDYAMWAALAAVFALVLLRRASGPEEGTLAAPIDLPLLSKQGRFHLHEQPGKPVLIEVFASWCGACRRSTPAFADAYREHGGQVRFIGVMIDDDAREARRAFDSWAIPYDVALDDGSVAKTYNVRMLPTTVLVDRNGVVRRVWSGAPSRAMIESWLRAL